MVMLMLCGSLPCLAYPAAELHSTHHVVQLDFALTACLHYWVLEQVDTGNSHPAPKMHLYILVVTACGVSASAGDFGSFGSPPQPAAA